MRVKGLVIPLTKSAKDEIRGWLKDRGAVVPLPKVQVRRQVEFRLPLFKANDEKRIAYYWLSQVETPDGKFIKDSYGHIIREGTLEDNAFYFMKEHRVAGFRHMDRNGKKKSEGGGDVKPIGTVVGSWVTTREWQAAVGLEKNALPVGWMVAVYVENDDVWQAIKRGELPDMSLGGDGYVVETEIDEDRITGLAA